MKASKNTLSKILVCLSILASLCSFSTAWGAPLASPRYILENVLKEYVRGRRGWGQDLMIGRNLRSPDSLEITLTRELKGLGTIAANADNVSTIWIKLTAPPSHFGHFPSTEGLPHFLTVFPAGGASSNPEKALQVQNIVKRALRKAGFPVRPALIDDRESEGIYQFVIELVDAEHFQRFMAELDELAGRIAVEGYEFLNPVELAR